MTLLDSMAGVAAITVLAGMALPLVAAPRRDSQVSAAARYVSSQAMLARARAVKNGAAVGLRFETHADGDRFTAFVDGDGDGIRSADIARGVDRRLDSPQALREAYPAVRFGLGASTPPVGASRFAGPDADPVRFGRGDTLTFSPLGTATSGTLYLRGRDGEQYAVRVLGATARVRVLRFDPIAGAWSDR